MIIHIVKIVKEAGRNNKGVFSSDDDMDSVKIATSDDEE